MPQHRDQRKDDLTALRIVRAHAPQPEAIFLRAVINGQLVPLQEFLPIAGGEAHRIPITFEVEEKFGPVVVLPLACVHGPAPQADDDWHMLNPYWALLLTGAASGALERRLLGNVNGHQRIGSSRAVLIQIIPDTER